MQNEIVTGLNFTDQQYVSAVWYSIQKNLYGSKNDLQKNLGTIASEYNLNIPEITQFIEKSGQVGTQTQSTPNQQDIKVARALWQYGMKQQSFKQHFTQNLDVIARETRIPVDSLKSQFATVGSTVTVGTQETTRRQETTQK